MNNEKMTQFIVKMRKEKKLTQKELAGYLGVTDKAVSKWERGLSCPDISLLSKLSEILGITTSELLNGEKTEVPSIEMESIIETTVNYADTATKSKFRKTRIIFAVILSAISIIGILSCIIIDLAISGNLTWSLYPICSTILFYLIVIPVLVLNKKGVFVSLVVLSVLIIPYLFAIEKIIGIHGLLMPIGMPTSIIGIIYIWIIYILFVKTKLPKYMAASITVFLILPVSICIDGVVNNILNQPLFSIWDSLGYFTAVVVAIVIFAAGYAIHKKI